MNTFDLIKLETIDLQRKRLNDLNPKKENSNKPLPKIFNKKQSNIIIPISLTLISGNKISLQLYKWKTYNKTNLTLNLWEKKVRENRNPSEALLIKNQKELLLISKF